MHTALQEALLGSADAAHVLAAIPQQMEVIAMLRHINSELKVPGQAPNPAFLLLIARRLDPVFCESGWYPGGVKYGSDSNSLPPCQ